MRLALSSLFVLVACAPPMADAIEDARAARELPPELELRFEERGGSALGARDIVVYGDGRLSVVSWRPGFASGAPSASGRPSVRPDASASYRVTASDVRNLLALVLELEGWEQRVDDDLPGPALEQARAWLRLRVGDARSDVWEHHADLEGTGRLVRVRSALEALVGAAVPDSNGVDVDPDVALEGSSATDATVGGDEGVGADDAP